MYSRRSPPSSFTASSTPQLGSLVRQYEACFVNEDGESNRIRYLHSRHRHHHGQHWRACQDQPPLWQTRCWELVLAADLSPISRLPWRPGNLGCSTLMDVSGSYQDLRVAKHLPHLMSRHCNHGSTNGTAYPGFIAWTTDNRIECPRAQDANATSTPGTDMPGPDWV